MCSYTFSDNSMMVTFDLRFSTLNESGKLNKQSSSYIIFRFIYLSSEVSFAVQK